MTVNERLRLKRTIEDWCQQNVKEASLEHQDSPLGERFEIRWVIPEDPTLVRFIDVYPRDENRITIQKGIVEATQQSTEQARAKGTLYNRTVDQVSDTLSQLKPFTDGMSRAQLMTIG